MKTISTLCYLAVTGLLAQSAAAVDITIDCVAGGVDCHLLKQVTAGKPQCEGGQTVPTTASFTIKYCNSGGQLDLAKEKTYTWIKGEAAKNTNGGSFVVRELEGANLPFVNNCYEDTFNLIVDTCGSHFNVNAYASVVGETDSYFGFETFMKRNCPLQTSVTCTLPNGNSCDTMAVCDPSGKTRVTYKYCYQVDTDSRQQITIRENYLPGTDPTKLPLNCENADCKETHAYIGRNFNADAFFNNFPGTDDLVIGSGLNTLKCFDKTHEVETCVSNKIPQAYVNAVGSVTATERPKSEPISDFKACFSSDKFDEVPLGGDGSTDSPATAKSKSPSGSGKGTKSPSGKGTTKSPSGKGGSKSPSVKGTKSPSGKGGSKSPSVKGTKSPTYKRLLRHNN